MTYDFVGSPWLRLVRLNFMLSFFEQETPRLQKIHKLDREKRAENTQNKSATTSGQFILNP